MMRALLACALLAFALVACASDAGDGRATTDGGRAGSPGSDGSQPRDATVEPDSSAVDAAPPRDSATDGQPAPVLGDDYVRYDALQPSPRGVVRLVFDAPADAVSFVATVDPDPAPRAILLLELHGPLGLLWSAFEDGPHAFEPLVRGNLNELAPYTVMLPSAPELPLVPGRYELALRVGTDGELPVRADVVFKRAASEPAGGTLPIALWFVEGAGLDAAAAAAHMRLQDGLVALADILDPAGIEVTILAPRDLAGDGAAELAVLDDDAETAELLARLAAEDAAASERALHVVFVASIDAGDGKTVRGKTTGLPGPPAHPELARRGAVILALDTLPVSAGRIGEMLAHEAAHYLGLRHTSEFDGERHDPLLDTPECPAERSSQTSSDGTPVLSAEDCADLDGNNLLFYTPPLPALAQDQLSADQQFVLLQNPLVR
jgi:hypothetical protein